MKVTSNGSEEVDSTVVPTESNFLPESAVQSTNKEIDVEKNLLAEESGTPVAPISKPTGQRHEGEWQEVPNSGGKNQKVTNKNLVYGQVRIIYPTRFDILRDDQEDGEIIPEVTSGKVTLSDSTPAVESTTEAVLATSQTNQSVKMRLLYGCSYHVIQKIPISFYQTILKRRGTRSQAISEGRTLNPNINVGVLLEHSWSEEVEKTTSCQKLDSQKLFSVWLLT